MTTRYAGLRPNRLKKGLQFAGRDAVGCWLFLGSPVVTEVLAGVGFDALIIDHEHSPGGLETAIEQLRAAGAGCSTVLARLADNQPGEVKRLLDAGVEGLMAANVGSAEEACAIVSAMRYPPRGRRGAHYTVSRATGWGTASAAQIAAAERETMLIAMIESAQGVEAIEAIAAVDGVDMLFIGPLDLSISVGEPGRYQSSAFKEALAEAEQRAAAAGAVLGCAEFPGGDARTLFARGYRFVTIGNDAHLLRGAAQATLARCGVGA